MQNLIDQLSRENAAARQAAAETYATIVLRHDHPEPGDAERLRELLPVLGLTPVDVGADVAALARLTGVERNVLPDDEFAAAQSADQAAADAVRADIRAAVATALESLADQDLIWYLAKLAAAVPGVDYHGLLSRLDDARRSASLRAGTRSSYLAEAARIRAATPRVFSPHTPPPPPPPTAAARETAARVALGRWSPTTVRVAGRD
jgi:hypothetical protein